MKQVLISMAECALPLPALAFVGGGAGVAESRELEQQLSVKPKGRAPDQRSRVLRPTSQTPALQGGLLLGTWP